MFEAFIVMIDAEGNNVRLCSTRFNKLDAIRDVFTKLHEEAFFTKNMPARQKEIDPKDISFIDGYIHDACCQGIPYEDADSFRIACNRGQVTSTVMGYGAWIWATLQTAEATLEVVELD